MEERRYFIYNSSMKLFSSDYICGRKSYFFERLLATAHAACMEWRHGVPAAVALFLKTDPLVM